MSKSRVFILACLGFMAGVLLGSWQKIDGLAAYAGMAACTVLIALFYFSDKRHLSAVAVVGCCVCAGMWRIGSSFTANEYENYLEKKVELEGLVVQEPDIRPDRQMIMVEPHGFRQRLLVTTTKAQEFFYGDRVYVSGKLMEPKVYDDFDYRAYLQRYHVYAASSYPRVLILKSHNGNFVYEQIFRLKMALSRRIGHLLPEPQGSLLLGILIGARRGLPQAVTDDFTDTGLSHIVAASGYNMSVIIGALGGLAYIVGRRWSAAASLVFMVAFVILAGASASVVRAAIMGGLLLLAFFIGRLYSAGPAICASAAIMLLINPRILYWDVGFQLSFAATLGIVYGNPLFEKLTEGWPRLLGIKAIVITTCTATLATLPFVLLHFGRLSLVVLPANILVLPAIPAVMALGVLSLLPFVGTGFAYVTGMLLNYILWIAHRLAAVPFASVDTGLPAWGFWLYLALLAGAYAGLLRLTKRVEYSGGT